MSDQYGHHLPDEFRQLMTHFPLNPPQGAGSSAESYFFHSRNNVALPLLPHHHHHHQQQQQQHDTTIMVGEVVQLPGGGLLRFGGHDRDHHHHHHTSNTSTPAVSANTGGTSNIRQQQQQHVQQQLNINGGVEMESGIWSFGNEGGGGDNNSRWPRQETLTLLEIRSRLDSKFKEANHKKPLWDEVSRIMAEEYGYYRSEKKCREKFENLYKYYKKTKDGKAGRQDGKHYRFFRQLEALYGETSNNHNNQISASESHPHDNDHHQNTSTLLYQNPNNQLENQEINQEALDNIHDDHHHQKLSTDQSLSVSNTSEFETASSENNIDHHHDHDDDLSAIAFMMNQKSRERQKRVTINESRSSDTRKIKRSWKAKVENFVDSQMRKVMESQEAWMERMLKTIEDREQDRLFKEEKWRKQEMARFDRVHGFWAKERARIEARDAALMEALQIFTGRSGQNDDHHMINSNIWTEPETSSLVQIISSLEPQFQEDIWEEISTKMASLGYYKSAIECKEKWENMQMYFSLANKKHMKQSTLESMDLINEEKKFWEKGKNKQV
ncbi:hypothetical protein LWI29_034847 [Acer saccharum]|uniref:Myb-like domain-containing protein n=1 Tax=Acer saccharum TaxID=4024 RepID=A0AA39SI70_ACESA|nr:hypothetical protein LWI29_034847 [Acer saccharum]